jgi:glycosyltransferase involved in cell wall biosynthesis
LKLIIQIPCFNEEEHLPVTLHELPRSLPGIDVIEYLVIDDGSSDRTVEKARELGVHHIVRLGRHLGLAKAFVAGLDAAVRAGADVIVNTDADNQYCAADIAKLVEPVLQGAAEMVVGARPIMEIAHWSPIKKALQRLGSWAVRIASGTEVADAPSGFRAISRNAAIQLRVFNQYTYTLETIIQAGQRDMPVISVPIRTNGELRPSRLIKSIPRYIVRSLLTMVRIFIIYRPVRFFALIGGFLFLAGLGLGVRYLVLTLAGWGAGHIQSLILAAVFLLMGFIVGVLGILADIISVNRRLLEDLTTRVWRLQESLDGRPGAQPMSGLRVAGGAVSGEGQLGR